MVDLKKCKVLVTPTTFGVHAKELRLELEEAVGEVIYNSLPRALRAQELIPLVRDVDGFIAGLDEIDSSVIQAAPKLKVIARYGVGLDNIDLQEATRRGIVVSNTPGANSAAVAELTVGLIIALARRLTEAVDSTRRGLWPRLSGMGLRGKTVGIVGLGRIGREGAIRLRGFGCKVAAHDPAVKEVEAKEVGAELLPLEKLLEMSHVVCLHLPLMASTRKMVNRDFLARMKKGAFLVNTARGELVDEEALIQALETGHLAGAGLDCLSLEPPQESNPLIKMPQVLLTPHMGAHTDEATSAMGWMSVEACLAVLRGGMPEHVVNPEVYSLRRSQEGG